MILRHLTTAKPPRVARSRRSPCTARLAAEIVERVIVVKDRAQL
jgi:hypothetical protein